MTPFAMRRVLKLDCKKSIFKLKQRFTCLLSCHWISIRLHSGVKEAEHVSEEGCPKEEPSKMMKTFIQKYDNPSLKEAVHLANIYGDAENIVKRVLEQFVRAEIIPSCTPFVTNHLNGLYWKASLLLPYPLRLSATAVHPDREVAEKRVYLSFCERLQSIGLICQADENIWEPLKHEQVTIMLDTLAKYGEEIGGRASGKGVKVLLEQLKHETFKDRLISIVEPQTCDLKDKLFRANSIYNHRLGVSHKDRDNLEETRVTGYDKISKMLAHEDVIDGEAEFSCQESFTYDRNVSRVNIHPVDETLHSLHQKLKWKCTVHVGWPFPFSVYSYGASLPSAQLMGYLAVASKLKTLCLLTSCSNKIWEDKLKLYICQDKNATPDMSDVGSFKADAELFCDASYNGYGAYLLQKDTQRISWISEPWESQPGAIDELFVNKIRRKARTTQQELFSVANALFTWKRKLRNKRLLIFCDNVGVVYDVNRCGKNFHHYDSNNQLKPAWGALLQLITSVQKDYNISLKAVWLDRYYNVLADQLSKQNYNMFQRFVAPNKSKAKKINIQPLEREKK